MGYFVTTTDVNFSIPKQNLGKAYAALCALNDNDEAKSGGSYGAAALDKRSPRPAGMNYHPARWYAWMPANYPQVCPDTKAVLEALGFDVNVEVSGDVRILCYDSKIGDEHLFVEALAPFVAEGSYICWRGEDDVEWRDLVKDGRIITQRPTKTWG